MASAVRPGVLLENGELVFLLDGKRERHASKLFLGPNSLIKSVPDVSSRSQQMPNRKAPFWFKSYRHLKDFSTSSTPWAPWKMTESQLFVPWRTTLFVSSLISFIIKMRSCSILDHLCWGFTRTLPVSYSNHQKLSFLFWMKSTRYAVLCSFCCDWTVTWSFFFPV